MSKIREKNINVHAQKIAELCKQYKSGEPVPPNIIRKMRIIHGCAIYDVTKELQNLANVPIDRITDDDWIKVSVNASLLSIIQGRIDSVDKTNTIKQESIVVHPDDRSLAIEFQSAGNVVHKPVNNNIVANVRRKANGVDEISVTNVETEYNDAVHSDNLDLDTPNLFSEDINVTNSLASNNTDYINNLNTSEAMELVNEYDKSQRGGNEGPSNQKIVGIYAPSNQDSAAINKPSNQTAIAVNRPSNQDIVSVTMRKNQTGGTDNLNKPIIINFWADWCPASNRFKPMWDNFKSSANQKFPELQVKDVNVKKDNELAKYASNVGVEGYPTVVLLNKNKIHQLVGNRSVKDIENFVNKHVS